MKYTVIIATSQKRTDWLINRSLLSVYRQIGIDKKDWSVLIIDDNIAETEIVKIQVEIELLRKGLNLKHKEFPTQIIKNQRTPFMSGTGAWNTGIFEVYNISPNGFVSILDDDDEYLPNHLSECVSSIKIDTVAVFQRLIWQNDDKSTMNIDLTKNNLTAENFFIGNPGVQGSNMFFKTKALVDIGGFDETLPNTTDRDLMIRFLWKNDLDKIEVIESIGINHYNHKREKVNNDIIRKKHGLDLFYKKFKYYFSEEAYHESLVRAKKIFNYSTREQIVICMPLKNAEKTIEKTIYSVLDQKNTKREIVLLIGIDNSTDNSETILRKITSLNQNVVLLNVNFGKVYLNRNFLNEYARKNFPNCVLIGRLDADDVIYSENTISEIEKLFDEFKFDVLMCGNKQVKNGNILEWENKPSKNLLQEDFLLIQLFEMAQGNPKAELPSCNTFIKPSVKEDYPNKVSAEDHWFTVSLLLQKKKLNILIDENLLYCYYSLNGVATDINKRKNKYLQSRDELYNFVLAQIKLKRIKYKWENFISHKGLTFHIDNIKKNKKRLKSLWSLKYPIYIKIKNELIKFKKKNISLLDVCCGPFPKSGIYDQFYSIDRILVDSLADEYHKLLDEYSICRNGQSIINANVEEIAQKFPNKKFDIIFCKNGLDHTYNPYSSIKQMIRLLTKNGVIILEHYIKEGEYTNYYGLHQWDFYINNEYFYISNREKDVVINMNTYLNHVKIKSFYEENKIFNIIRKTNVRT